MSLRTGKQIAIARLQDRVVEALFDIEPNLVMHGGTAIWRCYNGNRFSEDIDLYATDKQMSVLANKLSWALSKRNVTLDYPKYSVRILTFSDDFAKSKLEAMKPQGRIVPVQREYTRANGTKFAITTLSLQDFLVEKVSTYQKRRYVRDLYDVYHLLNMEKPLGKAKKAVSAFAKNIERPIDEEKLKDLVYVGVAPTFETMTSSIRGIG